MPSAVGCRSTIFINAGKYNENTDVSRNKTFMKEKERKEEKKEEEEKKKKKKKKKQRRRRRRKK